MNLHCRTYMHALPALLAIFLLSFPCQPAHAASDSIEIVHLPLNEAADIARSQLSAEGKVAQIPSRRLLIISDDDAHLNQARAWLKKLDVAVPQLLIRVTISEQNRRKNHAARLDQRQLPGGWVRISAATDSQQANRQRQFSLRTTSGSSGHIEAGEIRTSRRAIHSYLARYGIVEQNSVELVEISAGFDVQATLLADASENETVRLRIHPWFKRTGKDTGFAGKTEILVDAGSTLTTAQPPSGTAPLRINMQPNSAANQREIIYISDAQTEMTAKLGESLTIATANSSADEFASALTAYHSLQQQRDILIRLHVSRIR
ncbi:MAG: hypothetical protein R8K53_02615 [Mariprofundaceae bacterium]